MPIIFRWFVVLGFSVVVGNAADVTPLAVGPIGMTVSDMDRSVAFSTTC